MRNNWPGNWLEPGPLSSNLGLMSSRTAKRIEINAEWKTSVVNHFHDKKNDLRRPRLATLSARRAISRQRAANASANGRVLTFWAHWNRRYLPKAALQGLNFYLFWLKQCQGSSVRLLVLLVMTPPPQSSVGQQAISTTQSKSPQDRNRLGVCALLFLLLLFGYLADARFTWFDQENNNRKEWETLQEWFSSDTYNDFTTLSQVLPFRKQQTQSYLFVSECCTLWPLVMFLKWHHRYEAMVLDGSLKETAVLNCAYESPTSAASMNKATT